MAAFSGSPVAGAFGVGAFIQVCISPDPPSMRHAFNASVRSLRPRTPVHSLFASRSPRLYLRLTPTLSPCPLAPVPPAFVRIARLGAPHADAPDASARFRMQETASAVCRNAIRNSSVGESADCRVPRLPPARNVARAPMPRCWARAESPLALASGARPRYERALPETTTAESMSESRESWGAWG